MFFEERSHVFRRAAVRTKDRSELKTDVQRNKFEFRAKELSTNQIAAMWRAFVQCTAARQQFSLLFFTSYSLQKLKFCKQRSLMGLFWLSFTNNSRFNPLTPSVRYIVSQIPLQIFRSKGK